MDDKKGIVTMVTFVIIADYRDFGVALNLSLKLLATEMLTSPG